MIITDKENTYRAALIGCGMIAGGYDRLPLGKWTATHAGAYRLCPRTKLVAVSDTAAHVLAQFGRKWGVERLYHDYHEMLERERPDIVSICVPTEGHLEAFRAACHWNARAIFLEKPIAIDEEQGREMIALARGRPVAVNYFRRWNPTFHTIKKELENGIYGRPLRVTVHYMKGLLSNGSHFIDLLRWFFGEVLELRTVRTFKKNPEDAAADCEMVFSGGILTTFLHLPTPQYVLHDVDIFTDRARIVLGQRGQKILRFSSEEEPYFKKFRILRLQGEVEETEWRNCPLRAIEELISCIERGGKTSCTLDDGLKAIELCGRVLAEKAHLLA
jgi:predicted dehydrogenase